MNEEIYLDRIKQKIIELLPKDNSQLSQAMLYSSLSPGKRLRPLMLLNIANMFAVNPEYSFQTAAAIEIIHKYSLVHDDLPAMDNDDYRSGELTCHKKFDEPTAILAGVALLTIAFEILADEKTHPDPNIRSKLISILANNIGHQGMAGGQMLDIIYEKKILPSVEQLIKAHQMKTAKLFVACCHMGAVLGFANKSQEEALINFAQNFGLAYQIIDDLEDLNDAVELKNNNIAKINTIKEITRFSTELLSAAEDSIKIFGEKSAFLNKLIEMLYVKQSHILR